MKNVSTLKSSKTDSPKTPGGISKSLLTPCRRVGLSRNFRKSGASPFQSPLSSSTEVKQEKVETRKRKESLEETPQKSENVDGGPSDQNTPSRRVELPRRKKSKILLASIDKSSDENGAPQENKHNTNIDSCESINTESIHHESKDISSKGTQNMSEEAVTPLRLKSKSRIKKNVMLTNSICEPATELQKENVSNNTISLAEPKINKEQETKDLNKESPNNLTKECIVVIQKKIFKKELIEKEKLHTIKEKLTSSPKSIVSQPTFDSDSDDVPLICLNKALHNKPTTLNTIVEDDQDFDTSKTKITKPVKTYSKTKLKSPANKLKSNTKIEVEIHQAPISQNSDDDDDFYEKKRTILIRKSYDKETKLQKAKSTGSITQKDIDDLRARIETKKKLLLARAMTEDTKELRDLIKKWQKGCQDALMELMDLMKSKFPDKQNMEYSEILQTLKIPSSLVGYDSDNDCFLTPDDENIILAKV